MRVRPKSCLPSDDGYLVSTFCMNVVFYETLHSDLFYFAFVQICYIFICLFCICADMLYFHLPILHSGRCAASFHPENVRRFAVPIAFVASDRAPLHRSESGQKWIR